MTQAPTVHNDTTTPDNVFDQPQAGHVASTKPPTGSRGNSMWITAIIGVAIVGLLGGFVAGMQVGKSSGGLANASFNGQMPGGSGQAGMRGVMGTVTAVDSDSITVKDQMQGESATFTISSTTTVTDNGATASVSDISVGDRVMIQTGDSTLSSTDTNKTATSIQINPTMQGGPGGSSTQNSSSI